MSGDGADRASRREAIDGALEPQGRERARRLERAALAGMAFGVALMLQPWWSGGMGTGFFVTLASTIAQIVLGHMAERDA